VSEEKFDPNSVPDFYKQRKDNNQAKALSAQGITQEQLLARREKVFELRAVKRLTYQEIADILGVSIATIYCDAKWITRFKVRGLIEKDKRIVAEQDVIYSALIDRWLPVALDPQEEPDTAMYATDRVARLLVDQAKIHGFHSTFASKGVSAKEVGEEIGTKVLEAMMKLAQMSKSPIKAEIIDQNVIENE
jgi:DNA-binding CsgD family transcriptional regulator